MKKINDQYTIAELWSKVRAQIVKCNVDEVLEMARILHCSGEPFDKYYRPANDGSLVWDTTFKPRKDASNCFYFEDDQWKLGYNMIAPGISLTEFKERFCI